MSAVADRRNAALLRWLEACAAHGDACPSGTAIAERFGLSPCRGTEMLDRLQSTGLITIAGSRGRKVVTIVATGRATVAPQPMTPPRRARGRIGASA
ncbi:hypothetical protein [Sphingomonas solaris]|uniref:LexA repressor DNA-binding domain-containing protein n=1 Tax=Alterirhizorhabdus solaris TaxID=2529389 RepID=A0A558R878_9SPHN|nr:hypothetical protein [Sphingomonas solaris]TVV75566.1 hypothetical protein FOY91_06815 [Sphingomonas solaris]